MRTRIWLYLAFICAILITGCATPFRDDSGYVRLGQHSGYYLVRHDSTLRDQLHLTYAPTSDTGSPLHRGHGTDVLAFRFSPRGGLSAAPAYLCQLRPEGGVIARLARLSVGRSRLTDVERLFGRVHTVVPKLDGLLVYYSLPVYNPLEEAPSGFR